MATGSVPGAWAAISRTRMAIVRNICRSGCGLEPYQVGVCKMKNLGALSTLLVGLLAAPAFAANYQDLWWNPAESGWGINITHQGDTMFATWFIYDAAGKPLWLVMSNGVKSGSGSFSGDLYRTSGPA